MTALAAHHNVASPERWVSVVAGAAVAAYGLKRKSVPGAMIAALGGALVWRGATGHCPVYESIGISTARDDESSNVSIPYGRGIRVEQSVVIPRSAEELYSFWRNFENLPRFMSHLESVTILDSGRSHWIARGPAGAKAEWDAELINDVPGQLIAWRSIEGSRVDNAGSVHFEPAPRGTRTRVILRYDPPAGALGAAIAKLFGEDPDRQIAHDLEELKQLFSDV